MTMCLSVECYNTWCLIQLRHITHHNLEKFGIFSTLGFKARSMYPNFGQFASFVGLYNIALMSKFTLFPFFLYIPDIIRARSQIPVLWLTERRRRKRDLAGKI